jgi:hypothetical protein
LLDDEYDISDTFLRKAGTNNDILPNEKNDESFFRVSFVTLSHLLSRCTICSLLISGDKLRKAGSETMSAEAGPRGETLQRNENETGNNPMAELGG